MVEGGYEGFQNKKRQTKRNLHRQTTISHSCLLICSNNKIVKNNASEQCMHSMHSHILPRTHTYVVAMVVVRLSENRKTHNPELGMEIKYFVFHIKFVIVQINVMDI